MIHQEKNSVCVLGYQQEARDRLSPSQDLSFQSRKCSLEVAYEKRGKLRIERVFFPAARASLVPSVQRVRIFLELSELFVLVTSVFCSEIELSFGRSKGWFQKVCVNKESLFVVIKRFIVLLMKKWALSFRNHREMLLSPEC